MEHADRPPPSTMEIVFAVAATYGSQGAMMIALLLAAAGLNCPYDHGAMMALSQQAFDQDMTGGWRELSMRGCKVEAPDTISGWHEANRLEHDSDILYWHEGQLRADPGQTAAAIALFERSRKSVEEDHGMGWNLYVDGTIAFLRRDRPAFDKSRAALAALPR